MSALTAFIWGISIENLYDEDEDENDDDDDDMLC